MRNTTPKERMKRGCYDCADKVSGYGAVCKHDVCPYSDLDDHDSYRDYIKSTGGIPSAWTINLLLKGG